MEREAATTTFSVYRSFRQCIAEILLQQQGFIDAMQTAFNSTGKPQHQVLSITHRERQFILAIYHSAKLQYCNLYQLTAGRQYTEAFTYDFKNNKCTWYHDHFFYRYAARFSLTHKPHHEAIRHYFLNNPLTVFSRYIKKKKNFQHFMAVVRHGTIYGYLDLKNNILNYRTIIDNFSLTDKKNKYAKPLRHILYKLETGK